jgi:hypothetical protein
MQVEGVSSRVGNFPSFGETGANAKVGAAGEETVEKELVDAFRLSVEADAGV